jgi:hypothetical protein
MTTKIGNFTGGRPIVALAPAGISPELAARLVVSLRLAAVANVIKDCRLEPIAFMKREFRTALR